ncbi:MAG: LysR family transcriptional regulator [Verrucomicrobiota bacterium]|jgi:DNA-binding transcriptional LysR family regulator
MELRYLRYFAMVAELGSFTRAAERLHVAQPAISQQIKTLEEELGVRLLLRNKRSVKLTAAGHTFLRDATDILARAEASRTNARRAAKGEIGTLSVGCFSSASSLFLPELIQIYQERFPAVRVHLAELTPGQQLDAFAQGSIDVGFTRPLPRTHGDNFEKIQVYRDRIMAVLPSRHTLAAERALRLEKLAEDDWVLFKRSEGAQLVEGLTQLCVKAGFLPRIVSEPTMMQTVLMLVAAGVGVSLVPHCVSCFHQPGVCFIPIRPSPPPLDLLAVRPKGELLPTVGAFFDLLRQQLPRIKAKYEGQTFTP